MPIFPADPVVAVVRAESARFRHPLLMIHGLWTGNWIWSGFAAYLAHRGWESWSPSLLGRGAADSPDDRLGRLVKVCQALPAPPVIIAHDAGVVVASKLAVKVGSPAFVAITPVLPRENGGDLGAFRHPQFWPARFFAPSATPPNGYIARVMLGGLADGVTRLCRDSGAIFRSLLAGVDRLPDPPPRPGLLVCSPDDPFLPSSRGESVAKMLGWSFDGQGVASHLPMVVPGWESLADRVHRWLVLTLGEELLAFDESEGEGE